MKKYKINIKIYSVCLCLVCVCTYAPVILASF